MQRSTITIPEDVTASVDHLEVTIEGPNGTVTRRLWYPDVTVEVTEEERDAGDDESAESETVEVVAIESDVDDAKTRATVGTFESHVQNMVHGVTEGWEYRMQVHYAHFPMQVSVEDGEVVIENFLGERAPRRTPVRGDTEVTVDGEEVVLTGPDKEDVGQTAGAVEQLTRVVDKDTRVFQDGVYIVEKPETATGGA